MVQKAKVNMKIATVADKIKFRLEGDVKFMGGWNSGVFGEASPVGKDFVNLECGQARVFVKAGRTPGKVMLAWRCANGHNTES